MSNFSFITNAHPSFIENMYEQYQANPESIDETWASFFKGFEYASKSANGNGAAHVNGSVNGKATALVGSASKELNVASLIDAYRHRGHLLSTTNPIRERRDRKAQLALSDYGLSESDLNQKFAASALVGVKDATLKEVIARLENIYCGNIGFEYAHIENNEKRLWLRERIEKVTQNQDWGITNDKKKRILEKLNGAVGFENFLHTKYVGQKRFS